MTELVLNGVDATSGGYLHPPVKLEGLLDAIAPEDSQRRRALARRERFTDARWALGHGYDANDLAVAGWAVLTSDGVDPAVLDALGPLLEHRRAQAKDRYRAFVGAVGYRPAEQKADFLRRFGAGPGPVRPERVPYYVLIVGGPSDIPFQFQFDLAVQHAVGRVAFDTPDEYRNYAENVLRREGGAAAQRRSVAVFGPRNPDDPATALSGEKLVGPLVEALRRRAPARVEALMTEAATKDALGRLLADGDGPDLLFTAGHGLGTRAGQPRQDEIQGALVCQEWPGPEQARGMDPGWFLAGEDAAAFPAVRPAVIFAFACYGAGTPDRSSFVRRDVDPVVAPSPFLARLPAVLLGHPSGAIGFVGHVDRVWSYSFVGPAEVDSSEGIVSTLLSVLAGERLGHAMQYMAQRWAELSTMVSGILDQRDNYGIPVPDPRTLVSAWTASHDARNYVVLGDPAVRID